MWNAAYENMNKIIMFQAKYYNERPAMVEFTVGDIILLNTVNLKLKGVSGKLRKEFIGPFRVTERISI